MRMGAMAMVDAAESLAQKSPSGLENEAMNAVRGAALAAVRLRLQKASFQDRRMGRSEGGANGATNAVRGAAVAAVRLRLQKASFQDRMMASSEVEAMPGSESGSSRWRSSSLGCAPSMRPASRTSRGT